MKRGTLSRLVDCLSAAVEKLPARPEHSASSYTNKDAVNSAFSAFFFQFPSFLRYMREMQELEKRDNVQSLFDVKAIPCDNQIRNIADGIDPAAISPVFNGALKAAEISGVVKEYRTFYGGVLMALDGLWHFGSEKLGCPHCLTKKTADKKGREYTMNYHAAVVGAIVKPGSNRVLPVAPEMIRNEDGQEKQDCELNAVKRWLEKHGEEYAWLNPTLLGDDLYSKRPFCEAVSAKGWGFIFTCRDESHKWLSETVRNSPVREISEVKWDPRKKKRVVHTWKYVNGVPIRYDEKNPFLVNWLSYEARAEGASKPSYRNSWVTNKPVTEHNVAYVAECGRARWKIENEHNNVLKNRGYNLTHNFGHGKKHAADVFFLLNLLALQFHTILEYCDEEYRLTYTTFSVRIAFFEALRVLIRRRYFGSWEEFLRYVRGKDEDACGGG